MEPWATTAQVRSLPREPGADNEDAHALADGIAVVVDGAGIPKHLLSGCSHSVSWYSSQLARAVCDELARRHASITECLAAGLASVAAMHPECDLAAGSPSATIACWRIRDQVLEYLVLCDASIILVGRDGRASQVTDDRLGELVDVVERELDSRDDISAARTEILETLRNRDGGWWCCHHDPAAAQQAITGSVQLAELSGVIATSDGATRGHELLDCLPLPELAQLVLSGRADDAVQRIRSAEDARADWLHSRLHKRHDDLTLAWLAR